MYMNSKTKRLLSTVFAAFMVVATFNGCKKDDYKELLGVCPIVVSTYPMNEAVGVKPDSTITVTFNTDMNPGTITQAAFTMTGGAKVSGTLTYDAPTKTATFTPDQNLMVNTEYTATVSTLVKDVTGNAMQE